MSRSILSRLYRVMGIALVALAAFSLTGPAFGQAVWTNAIDGLWSDGAKWSAGVPNLNLAKLTAGNGSYTVTVDAVLANPFSGLTITNNWENTTVLDVNAAGFESCTGRIFIGRGALVRVNAGGEMKYTGTNTIDDSNFGNTFVGIKDGGEWLVNGGTVNFADLEVSGSRSFRTFTWERPPPGA